MIVTCAYIGRPSGGGEAIAVSEPALEPRMSNGSELVLDDLMSEVRRTRCELRTALDSHRGIRAFEVVEARQQSTAALESFVAALDERLLPVPRQIRDELRLMRSLSARS